MDHLLCAYLIMLPEINTHFKKPTIIFTLDRDIVLFNFMGLIYEVILNVSGKMLQLENYIPINFHQKKLVTGNFKML